MPGAVANNASLAGEARLLQRLPLARSGLPSPAAMERGDLVGGEIS